MKNYLPPTISDWQGRSDSLPKERLFQIIECIDLNTQMLKQKASRHFAFLGFACDEGIRRNQGRVGAKEAPAITRKFLANLPAHEFKATAFSDIGNVSCINQNLESAQETLAFLVNHVLQAGLIPIVLGGGHEVAFGHYQGIAKAERHHQLGIINFDAHFDLRPLLANGQGHSGSPFLQIANSSLPENFHYCCLGIQNMANTLSLFKKAEELNVHYFKAEEIRNESSKVKQQLKDFIDAYPSLYITFCLDVLAEAVAPGVSAPSASGLWLSEVIPLLEIIFTSGKVISFDIAEFSPPLDQNHQSARVIAYLLFEMIRFYSYD